jgi:gliding motility-associated-like protein
VVSVFPSPNVEFTAYPYSDCEPLWAAFTDNSTSDSSIISWLWNFGDPESGSNTSTEQNPSHFYNYDGTYNVTLSVTTINGCIEIYTSHGMITVYPQPEANFYAQPEVALTQNPVISFTDQSSNNTSYWNWNFGDPGSGINNTSTEQNPSHTYNSEGIYDVLLIISNYNNTCFDTIIKQVEIVNLTIPNVFTPNNDGKNDCFHIINIEKLKNNQLIIFNRWGNLIYEKSNYQNDWDGKNCPAGVYYYILKLPDNNSNYHDSGTVTIIR